MLAKNAERVGWITILVILCSVSIVPVFCTFIMVDCNSSAVYLNVVQEA